MNPMKLKFCGSPAKKLFANSNIKLEISSISNMENCVLCSKKVFAEIPASFSSDDGLLENGVLKAEVTSRFSKIFNRVCRLVNEADAANGNGKLRIVETTDGNVSKLPTLCQECADKVQTVDTLTNLLKGQVSEIRTLLANTQIQKNTEVIQSDYVNMNQSSPKEKIKYDREFLLQLSNKKVEYFNVLEHGLPDLVPKNTFGITPDSNGAVGTMKFTSKDTNLMKTIGEKPSNPSVTETTTAVVVPTPKNFDSELSAFEIESKVESVGKPSTKRRIQYERDFLLEIGNTSEPKFFDSLGHGFPDLVRSYHLSQNGQSSNTKSTGKLSKKPETVKTPASAKPALNPSQAPVAMVSKPIAEELVLVINQPISANHRKSPENCPLEKLRELLGDPKLSPKNFNTVAIHCMDIPSSSVQPAIQMLLEKAIDTPKFSKKVTTLLHFILEKCEPNYQSMYRKLINAHCKLEVQMKFSEYPQVININKQLSKECDESVCDKLEIDLERLKYELKRRSLNLIKLMGLLYKEKLMETETIVETINKFVIAPDDEKLECVCLLFTIVGEYLEGDASVKAKWLKSQLSHLRQRAEGKKVSVKVRELILGLMKLYKNKWKWEGLSETDNATAMIFQKYSASTTKSFEALVSSTLFNFYFPGTEVGIFIENLCKLVAVKPHIGKVEDAGKLVRLFIANRNITKLETLFEISAALKTIVTDVADLPKTAMQLAHFLVEIFWEESNLDWLLICGKYIRLDSSPKFWEYLVMESLERLVFQTDEQFVRKALNKTTEKAELLTIFKLWEERKIKNCAKQIEDSLRPKIGKGESLNELKRFLRKHSWNPTGKNITAARGLMEAICILCWNTSTNNWNEHKLKFFLPLLELPNRKIFPVIWTQVEAFYERLGIQNRSLELLNIMYVLNLVS